MRGALALLLQLLLAPLQLHRLSVALLQLPGVWVQALPVALLMALLMALLLLLPSVRLAR